MGKGLLITVLKVIRIDCGYHGGFIFDNSFCVTGAFCIFLCEITKSFEHVHLLWVSLGIYVLVQNVLVSEI